MALYRRHQGNRLACVLIILKGLCSTIQSAPYSGGTGTPDDPYQIATAADLIALGETPEDYDQHFVLTADIDLDPNLPGGRVFDKAVIAPIIGFADWEFGAAVFTGAFDGNGHTISHLTIKGENFLGLLGALRSGARVWHLGLEAVEIDGTGFYIGGLVGMNYGGNITTTHSTGTVAGYDQVGGLVGVNYTLGLDCSSIATSYSTAGVTGVSGVGGLVGNNSGWIAASYSTGTVTGDHYVGGFVGANSIGYISGSYSTGAVVGNREVGGFVGHTGDGTTISNFWDVETSGQSSGDGAVGLTTARMQDINTFLTAGWDFVGEIHNGPCDYWQMSPGEYPQLRYGNGTKPAKPEGLGTSEQPYLIRDARDLGTIWAEPMACYRLEASVDLSGATWLVAVVPWFGGTFDGQGCEIRNLHIRGNGYLGLFGVLEAGATVFDLGLDTVDVNGTGTYVGALVGASRGTITACYSTGTVTGTGGNAGGLVGENGGSIAASRSVAVVTGHTHVGGLVGVNTGSIVQSHTIGTVAGDYNLGGLAGSSRGTITTSCSTSTVMGDYHRVGGLVGSNSGSITMSHATGATTGDGEVGGLVGFNWGSITACYSTSPVTGHFSVGGFVGFNRGRISASYATGVVDGDSQTGGLVGEENFWGSGTVSQCFWDIQTTGCASSASGTGKTTAEMQMAGTFLDAGWDFVGETANGTEDVWWIDEGKDYPRLWWETAEQ